MKEVEDCPHCGKCPICGEQNNHYHSYQRQESCDRQDVFHQLLEHSNLILIGLLIAAPARQPERRIDMTEHIHSGRYALRD